MATKEQGAAVKAASDRIFEAISILSEADIDRASFVVKDAQVKLHLSGDEDGFRFRFTAQKIVRGEDDSPPTKNEKLPGMTPNRAPERPIDIDKGDLS